MIGDFDWWDVVAESPTRIVLKISRSRIEDDTSDVKTVEEKLIADLPAQPKTPVNASRPEFSDCAQAQWSAGTR